MISEITLGLLLVLVIIAFFAGIGITTIGPGGIFVTLALYVLTPLSSAEIAGTAHATFVATGIVATWAYVRSGELLDKGNQHLAVVLSFTSILGALFGVQLNTMISRSAFGVLLGLSATITGVLLAYREFYGIESRTLIDTNTRRGQILIALLGLLLGTAAALVGVGGPVLAVPALVMLGIPMLVGLGIAQVQSIFISGFATVGYLSNGAVELSLVLLIGIPQIFGVVVGWFIAHQINPGRLKITLGAVLTFVGLHLVI